jgi:CheY-like chemotaxis protein
MENTNGQGAVGTVLIVDDTETSAAALELACATIPGIGVSTVSSALEAVRVLRDQGQPVSAVLTDIRMPHMDGFDLIRFIRADRRFAGTPIIVVTADTDPDTPARAALLGANAYFTKPFSPRAVRETLERLLHGNPTAE